MTSVLEGKSIPENNCQIQCTIDKSHESGMWDIKQLQGKGNDLRGPVYVNTHKEAEETCRQLTEKFVLFYSITEV